MITLPVIIMILVLLVLALVTPLFSPFYRADKDTLPQNMVTPDHEQEEEDEPIVASQVTPDRPLSIIITVHDNAHQLERVIDAYLSQEYNADYQVVIIIDENDTASEDVLKLRSENKHLYYTKLPISSRYLSRKKLAITIGLRAAKYDWCVITSIYCQPTSKKWLRNFASYISDDKNLVMGMTPYEKEAPIYYRYEQLRSLLYHLRTAEQGTAFSTNQSLVALRKSEFFKEQGFAGYLEYQRAEYEHLINKFARRNGTAIAIEPEAWLKFHGPSQKQWRYRHMHSIDSFPAMKRHKWFRSLFHFDLITMHVYNLLTVAAVIYGLVDMIVVEDGQMEGMLLMILAILFWVGSIVLRWRIYTPVLAAFGNIKAPQAIVLDWMVSGYNMFIRILYKVTDRYDFMTHRL